MESVREDAHRNDRSSVAVFLETPAISTPCMAGVLPDLYFRDPEESWR